ncbi:MAG: hypothetical protein HKP61_01880 [Dactylosporangium sp.]|nr:hypothetical protein [Dactylosporangium sp.]NNJ59713.1 hypothetical protein [Dactylosporangium sp.]
MPRLGNKPDQWEQSIITVATATGGTRATTVILVTADDLACHRGHPGPLAGHLSPGYFTAESGRIPGPRILVRAPPAAG